VAGRALRATAVLAALYGVAGLILAGWMAARGLAGRPVTTPAQLLDPGLTFLVPGDELILAPGAEPLVVTPQLAGAVALGNIGVFGGAGLCWLAAGFGLLAGRRWARALGLALFAGLGLVGLMNLAAEAALLALAGSLQAAGGVFMVATTVGFTALALCALPLAGFAILLRPGVAALCRAGGPGRPTLESGLILHFSAAALLLLPGALAPSGRWPPMLLLGPWLLQSTVARAGLLLLAGLHAACAWGWWRGRPWTVPLSLGLNVPLTLLAAASALAASRESLAALGAGLLPAGMLRGLMALAALLGVSLILAIRRAAPAAE
jgi:hypothetical protein